MLFFMKFGKKLELLAWRVSPKIHKVNDIFRTCPTHPFINETNFDYALYFRGGFYTLTGLFRTQYVTLIQEIQRVPTLISPLLRRNAGRTLLRPRKIIRYRYIRIEWVK